MFYYEILNPKQKRILSREPVVSEKATIINSWLGEFTEIMDHAEIVDSEIDNYSYVCEYSMVAYAKIGRFVSIAPMVRIGAPNHPYDWVSQHHFTYRSEKYGFSEREDEVFFNWRKIQSVKIGHDVWIGHGSVILPGVEIGNGAIVGAMSVVTEDVHPYSIVSGNPARIIRMRFPKKIAEAIERTKWWDWSHETLKERLEDFKDLRRFLMKYSK